MAVWERWAFNIVSLERKRQRKGRRPRQSCSLDKTWLLQPWDPSSVLAAHAQHGGGWVKDNEDPAPLRCSWEWMVSEDRESFSFEDDWPRVRFSCSHGCPTPTRKFKRKKFKRHKIGQGNMERVGRRKRGTYMIRFHCTPEWNFREQRETLWLSSLIYGLPPNVALWVDSVSSTLQYFPTNMCIDFMYEQNRNSWCFRILQVRTIIPALRSLTQED